MLELCLWSLLLLWYTAGESVCMYARIHAYGRACQVVGLKLAVWMGQTQSKFGQEGCGVPTTSTLTINDQRRIGSAPIGMICAGGGCASGSAAQTARCTTKAFSLIDTFQQTTSALPVALDQEHDRPGTYALMAGAASHPHPRMRFSRFLSESGPQLRGSVSSVAGEYKNFWLMPCL